MDVGRNLFSLNDDLWQVPLSSAGRMSAPPRRLTLGVGPYVDPAAGPSGEMVFARLVAQRAVERASLTDVAEPVARLYSDREPRRGERAEQPTDRSSCSNTARARSGKSGSRTRCPAARSSSPACRRKRHSVPRCHPMGRGLRIRRIRVTPAPPRRIGYVVETSGGVPRKICDACEAHVLYFGLAGTSLAAFSAARAARSMSVTVRSFPS